MGFERDLKSSLQLCLALFTATFLSGCGSGGAAGSSTPVPTPAPAPTLALAVSPSPLVVSQSDSFFVVVTAEALGTAATPAITLGALPAGLTTSSTFPMSVPLGGATIYFATSSSIAIGDATVSISGTAGGATATASLPLQVVGDAPLQLGISTGLAKEFQVVQGKSISIQGTVYTTGNSPIYSANLSVTGLPSGVTATVSPKLVEAGDSFTVTLTASTTAPSVQNAQWSILALPTGSVSSTSADYLLDVTPAGGGAGWNNQTSYVSTRATPFSAVYDPTHGLIYSANQVWDRIDLIDDKTRAIVKSISIQDPRGMDISIDGTTVWVTTGCQVMYGIDTTTLQATQYILPRYQATATNPGISWEGAQAFSLADGTVLLSFSDSTGSGIGHGAIWDPATNALTPFVPPNSLPVAWGVFGRSGDGKRIVVAGADESAMSYTYDVQTKVFSAPISLSDFGYSALIAINFDGSRIAVSAFGTPAFALYDGNFNLLGLLPGDGGVSGAGVFPAESLLSGGIVFSPDGKTIYEETGSTIIPFIVGIDVATQQVVALSPAMAVVPALEVMSPPFYLPAPFAVDASGMVLGIQYHGIAFDDATANLNYSSSDSGSPFYMQHMSVYSGPLAGGTTSSGFGNGFAFVPDVYYGGTMGSASLSSDSLSITSPAVATPGPVDLKMLFPGGVEVFDPQFFTFGTKIQDAIISGGSPQGGAAGQLDAFGLLLDPSQDTVTIGGHNATVTSTVTQYPQFTGEQTDMSLSYTLPSGSPGWADLTIATPNGASTLPKSFLFAKSVNDYATADSPTFVLYDKSRNQLYLSAGNHIDVFSLASSSFASPLNSPVSGSQFQGLALTPDGKRLLAADLTNGALAVIDPDVPSGSYEIGLAGSVSASGGCNYGPLLVAPDNQGNALVASGYVPGPTGCGYGGPSGTLFLANLTAKTAAQFNVASCGGQFAAASSLQATNDGSLIAMTNDFRIYIPAQQTCVPAANPIERYTVAVAGDGNVLGLDRAFVNPSGSLLGRFAYPTVLYPGARTAVYYNFDPYSSGALQAPRMNDAGSLYFWAYPNYIDIVDVRHGTPALRFGLTEAVTNTVAPLAIDSSGQRIFLITNKGLTVVDLGNAPLSVGHFSQTSASAGNQIAVRGSGFENGITATLGGVAASLTFTDSETLTLTIPSTNTGEEDLVLTNPDGKTYTLQNAVSVQ